MKTDPSAAPGAETEGRAVALNGAARPSLRDRHLCDKPSRPEAATQAAWSRTLFPYALPSRFQFTLNQDSIIVRLQPSEMARSFGFGLGATQNMTCCSDERANNAMQRTREQAGRFWKAFSASR